MRLLHRIAASLALACFAVAAPVFVAQSLAQAPERRFALVIGNSEYKAGRLPTAANDAGLIAEALRSAGFDVVGLVGTDAERTRRRAESSGVPQAFTDLDEAIRRTGAKVVTVATPPGKRCAGRSANFSTRCRPRVRRP